MEPIEVPPHAIWSDGSEDFTSDRWNEGEPVWDVPELDLGDGRRFLLVAPDPFPEEEWALFGAN